MSSLIPAFVAGILIGLSKAGIKGISPIIVTLLALVYGAKESTGILLPLLIIGDICAVIYYQKKCDWALLRQLLPYVALGVIIGAVVGKEISGDTFKYMMSTIIIISVIMMGIFETIKIDITNRSKSLGIILGLLAGITTMIGNLAGAFSNLFFISMRLPKMAFIGTAAWLFFIINLFKVPFHAFMWETISYQSLIINLQLIPFVLIGFVIGVKVVHFIKDQTYRYYILAMTFIGAVAMIIS